MALLLQIFLQIFVQTNRAQIITKYAFLDPYSQEDNDARVDVNDFSYVQNNNGEWDWQVQVEGQRDAHFEISLNDASWNFDSSTTSILTLTVSSEETEVSDMLFSFGQSINGEDKYFTAWINLQDNDAYPLNSYPNRISPSCDNQGIPNQTLWTDDIAQVYNSGQFYFPSRLQKTTNTWQYDYIKPYSNDSDCCRNSFPLHMQLINNPIDGWSKWKYFTNDTYLFEQECGFEPLSTAEPLSIYISSSGPRFEKLTISSFELQLEIIPTEPPTNYPSENPTPYPTSTTTLSPTLDPSQYPTFDPTLNPITFTTRSPSIQPSIFTSPQPTNDIPTVNPTASLQPTASEAVTTINPTQYPTETNLAVDGNNPSTTTKKIQSGNANEENPSYQIIYILAAVLAFLLVLCLCISFVVLRNKMNASKQKQNNHEPGSSHIAMSASPQISVEPGRESIDDLQIENGNDDALLSTPGVAANIGDECATKGGNGIIPDAPAPPIPMNHVKSASTMTKIPGEVIPDAPPAPKSAYLSDENENESEEHNAENEDEEDQNSDAASDDGILQGIETTDGR